MDGSFSILSLLVLPRHRAESARSLFEIHHAYAIFHLARVFLYARPYKSGELLSARRDGCAIALAFIERGFFVFNLAVSNN